ncbi:MAG: hypothetical protein K2K25_03510, partial [Muribaculaceae bacterium]|nr:hypothetical protein [Muribaculaceae bacterium]
IYGTNFTTIKVNMNIPLVNLPYQYHHGWNGSLKPRISLFGSNKLRTIEGTIVGLNKIGTSGNGYDYVVIESGLDKTSILKIANAPTNNINNRALDMSSDQLSLFTNQEKKNIRDTKGWSMI